MGPGEGELVFGAFELVVDFAGVHDIYSNPGGNLPAIADILQVAVEETSQVLEVFGRVSVSPLEIPMSSEPLFRGGDAAESLDRAAQVEMEPAGGDIDRDFDVIEVRNLVLPVGIHERVFTGHGHVVFDVSSSRLQTDKCLVESDLRETAAETNSR